MSSFRVGVICLLLSPLAACAAQGVDWQSGDATAPVVSATTPGDGAAAAAPNAAISATFSEAMDPATVTGVTFSLRQGTTPVSGTVSCVGVTALFTPAAALDPDTAYTATIASGARDLAGNALLANYVWTFTTGATPDTTRPTVVVTSPANVTTDVVLGARVSATFDAVMDPLTLTSATFTLDPGTGPVSGGETRANR